MIRKCVVCGQYTLLDKHCGRDTNVVDPPRYSERAVSMTKYRLRSRGWLG
ncbi:hypothetical protein DRN75_03380 [Nanoarchaeota archaeon]|nr:MAG: hypothetical protein DRN75_03380 [Nanoarchaeota archaeon]